MVPAMTRAMAFLFALLLALPATAAPKAEPWLRFAAHDQASAIAVDHAPWDRFLKAHVVAGKDGIARIAYAKIPTADKAALGEYVERLAATRVTGLARAEQRAYWINLYNALTVKVVLDRYPVDGIKDIRISPGLSASGPWGKKLLKIEGENVSLDDIEHRILRPVWKDPRIHYAVNCASIGCPNLPAEAFTTANAERLMDAAARAYINHPRGVRRSGGGVRLSSIYDWFRDDFGKDKTALFGHLMAFAEPALKEVLSTGPAIDGYDYDWSLNDAR